MAVNVVFVIFYCDKMTVNPAERKTKLSKHLMQMKFMQRGAIREEQEQLRSENQRAIDDEHWVLDVPMSTQSKCTFTVEPSFVICDNLMFGRRSFKGFNPEIEKICNTIDNNQALREAEEREKETSVNDEEMAERYQSLVGTITKKFTKRRHKSGVGDTDETDKTTVDKQDRNNSVPKTKKLKVHKKFLKPEDD